jgi:hypothetical protein
MHVAISSFEKNGQLRRGAWELALRIGRDPVMGEAELLPLELAEQFCDRQFDLAAAQYRFQ